MYERDKGIIILTVSAEQLLHFSFSRRIGDVEIDISKKFNYKADGCKDQD